MSWKKRLFSFQRPGVPAIQSQGSFGTIVFDNVPIPIVGMRLERGELHLVGKLPRGLPPLPVGEYGVTVYCPQGMVLASDITTCGWDLSPEDQGWMDLPIHLSST